jgi:hypothetical protein
VTREVKLVSYRAVADPVIRRLMLVSQFRRLQEVQHASLEEREALRLEAVLKGYFRFRKGQQQCRLGVTQPGPEADSAAFRLVREGWLQQRTEMQLIDCHVAGLTGPRIRRQGR